MRKTHRSGLSLAPWLLGLIIPVILSGCQVAGGGRFDSNQALAFGSIAVALFLLVMLVVQRSRYMRLLEDEVKKTGEKVREEADRRVEAARAEAAKEIKDKIAEARKEAQGDLLVKVKGAQEEAQLEAVKLVRETKQTAKAELEIRLNEVRDQVLAETERRILEIETRARQDQEQRVHEAEQRVRSEMTQQQQQNQQQQQRRGQEDGERRSREDAERRLQEARRRATQARNQRPAPPPRPPTPSPRPRPAQPPAQPVAEKAPSTPAMTMPWSTGPTSLNLPADGISILLAEDSSTMRRVFEITLAGENCKLVTAESGDQALDLARKIKPDLVIADLSLDAPDGYEICQQLKSNPETSDARVILLHGSAAMLDERKAQQSGAQGEITKPFTTAELLGKIQALF